MHISIRQMQIFQTVAQTQNYTRAAELLHMTQPAISMQIKQLEDNTGLCLFERQGKRIVLTAAGQAMHSYTQEVLTHYKAMIKTLTALKSEHQGYIRVSVATTAMYFVTKMLASFSQVHRDISVSLDITNRQAVIEQLQQYEADLVVMGEPPSTLEVDSQRLMANPLVLIGSPEHTLAQQPQPITFEQVAQETFIIREEGSGTRAALERLFNERNRTLYSPLVMSSNESIKYSVMAGLGLGVVSLHSIQLELASKVLVILEAEGFPIERSWYIVTRSGRWLSPAALAFKAYLVQQAQRASIDLPFNIISSNNKEVL